MRLFVALDLPFDLRERLTGLATGLPGARWLPPENFHLTLRFLGEMPSHRAEELDGALAAMRCRGFQLQLRGVGVFEKAGAAAIALGRGGTQPAIGPFAGQGRNRRAAHWV